MAKVTLIFSTQNYDQYERILAAATKQEDALNKELAQTTLRMAALTAPTKEQADAYAKLLKVQQDYTRARNTFAAAALTTAGATQGDLEAQAQAAADYQAVMEEVNDTMEEHEEKVVKGAGAQEKFAKSSEISRQSMIFAARGLAEFAGASREVTGAITALSSVHDVQSAAMVGIGLLFTLAAKKVGEWDEAQAKSAITVAQNTNSLQEYMAVQQKIVSSPVAAIRSGPELLGRNIGSAVDMLLSGKLGTNQEVVDTFVDNAKKQLDYERALQAAIYGTTKAAEARSEGLQEHIKLMIAEGQSYDKVFVAVANYRREVGLAVEDKALETGYVTRATEAYYTLEAALKSYNLVLTVQEQSQLQLEDTFKSQAAAITQSNDQYKRLTEALEILGTTDQAMVAAQLEGLGRRDEEEIAIKRLIPTLMEYHRIQGDEVPLNKASAAALHEEARGMLQAAAARAEYTRAIMAAAAAKTALNQLEVQHQRDLTLLNRQMGPAHTDTAQMSPTYGATVMGDQLVESERRIGEMRLDMARHYQQALADLERSLGEQRAEVARSYAERLGDFEENVGKQRTKMDENLAKTRERIEENYQETIRRINENYAASMFNIEITRDARAMVIAGINRDRQIKEANRIREKQKRDADKAHKEANEDLDESLADQRRLMERSHQRQLEAISRAEKLQREHMAASLKRQEEEMEISLQRQREAERRSYDRALKALNESYIERKGMLEVQLAAETALLDKARGDLVALNVKGFREGEAAAKSYMEKIQEIASTIVENIKMILDPAQFDKFFQDLEDQYKGIIGIIQSEPFSGGDEGLGDRTAALGAFTGQRGGLWQLHANEVVLPLGNQARMNQLLQQYVYPSMAQPNVPSYATAPGGARGAGGSVSGMVAVKIELNDGMLEARVTKATEGVFAEIVTGVDRNLSRGAYT